MPSKAPDGIRGFPSRGKKLWRLLSKKGNQIMADLQKLKARVLDDEVIDEDDVDLIYRELNHERRIDGQVVQFLIALRNEARRVCPLFQQFFFEAIEINVLMDG